MQGDRGLKDVLGLHVFDVAHGVGKLCLRLEPGLGQRVYSVLGEPLAGDRHIPEGYGIHIFRGTLIGSLLDDARTPVGLLGKHGVHFLLRQRDEVHGVRGFELHHERRGDAGHAEPHIDELIAHVVDLRAGGDAVQLGGLDAQNVEKRLGGDAPA